MAGHTRLRLRVQPGARTSRAVGRHGEAWKIRVTAAPERGQATRAVIALLADTLRVSRGDVRLVSGALSRDKIVEVAGILPDEIERRLMLASREETRR